MTVQNQQNSLQIPFLDVVEVEETGLTGGQPILVKKEPKVRDLGYKVNGCLFLLRLNS